MTTKRVQRRRGFGGYIDGFATSISPAGGLVWSSFIGGREADRVEGISVDQSLRIGLAGRTMSPDFRTLRPAQPVLTDKDYDALVVGIR